MMHGRNNGKKIKAVRAFRLVMGALLHVAASHLHVGQALPCLFRIPLPAVWDLCADSL